MSASGYFHQYGGLPPQTQLLSGKSIFTNTYAVLPKGVMSDIVTSLLPFWQATRTWIIARPMTGFSETFSHYIMEVAPGGGSDRPEVDPRAQAAIFVVHGHLHLTIGDVDHVLGEGGFAFIPAGTPWRAKNLGTQPVLFHWIRKAFEPVDGLDHPPPLILNEKDLPISLMPDTNGAWGTTRFMDPSDLRYDFHITIVTLQPGGCIPFLETHVMEHGLYVLQGKAVYRLNEDWVEVEAGDFMWLRAFCPQACYAGGPGPFRYLLYKDVNRHARLW